MNIIPKPKSRTIFSETADLNKINWIFENEADSRVVNEAYSISKHIPEGFPVKIKSGKTDCEAYSLSITSAEVLITSAGANGAFYALQTLKQLIAENGGSVYCQKIDDEPDMKYRGFYHDITRGKVPTLDTLKQLVDTMASYKLNSLQLYIEHTFEFKEYEFCKDELGYLTKDEITELERYCNSKFIELVPSISSFGHLYHLLQNDKYKHLCELPDYTPTKHYWAERMAHHTINPELDESFELIKSMLDQYMQVSQSDKFNICCDETFDLATGINKGKDKAELYVNFVKKIIGYLTSKGKTVMMWGDIILQHPEYINDLPENVIFLNWNYSKNPLEEQFKKIYDCGKIQILCPGTSSWNSFTEDIAVEEGNITGLADYAYKYDSLGLLNTNWGDYGNIASITMSLYGLILGSAVSWRKETKPTADFRSTASLNIFGNANILDLIAKISDIKHILNWAKAVLNTKDSKISEKEYKNALLLLSDILEKAKALDYNSKNIKEEVLNAIEGFMIIAAMCAKTDGFNIDTNIDINAWCDKYSLLWLSKNKPSELGEIIRVVKKGLSLQNN